jgi:hypothetical protein
LDTSPAPGACAAPHGHHELISRQRLVRSKKASRYLQEDAILLENDNEVIESDFYLGEGYVWQLAA